MLFLISCNRDILVSSKMKHEVNNNLSFYCLSVKDNIFVGQIQWTTSQTTIRSMQRMKINFSFPKCISTSKFIKLKGLRWKASFTSSGYNSHYLKEMFWNISCLHAVTHESCRHYFNWPQDLALKCWLTKSILLSQLCHKNIKCGLKQ